MKPAEMKSEYVRLRAEGKSYGAIAETLHISKTTCSAWEQELRSQIGEMKKAELIALSESYGMSKKARIDSLGKILRKIDAAIDAADFSDVEPTKLLDFKLKYTEALKGETAGLLPVAFPVEGMDAQHVLAALADLYSRVRTGEATYEQAQKESAVLAQLLKAEDALELSKRLEALENILGKRDKDDEH